MINYEDPELWQHLGIIIDAFERAALESETRAGFLAVSQGPLEAMDMVLHGGELLLGDPQWGSVNATASTQATENPSASFGFDLSADLDFAAIFNGDEIGDVARYLKDCVGCNTRINARWQVQPIDFLGPVGKLVDDINLALDKFSAQVDPLKAFSENLCGMLNTLSDFCIPDLLNILSSLKLLLRKYLGFSFEIRLDWTVILAPLLKLITEGVASLISGLTNVMMGPLDCSIAAIGAITQIQEELDNILAVSEQLGRQTVDQAKLLESSFRPPEEGESRETSVSLITTTNRKSVAKKGLDVRNRQAPVNAPRKDKEVTTGVMIKSLSESLDDKDFIKSGWSKKLLTAVNEAKMFASGLEAKIQEALGSLNQLTTGGLGLQLGNLGIVLFIKDLINLLTTVISLIKQKGKTDYCELLTAQPDLIQSHLERITNRSGLSIKVEANEQTKSLAVYQGPQRVTNISTCVNLRSSQYNSMLAEWIR